MLAKLVRALPEGPGWSLEVKFDGYRIEAIKNGAEVRLFSRRGNDFTKRFAKVAEAVSKVNATSAVLDGEVVAVDSEGHVSFQMLQNRSKLPAGWRLMYYAFDLLYLNRREMRMVAASAWFCKGFRVSGFFLSVFLFSVLGIFWSVQQSQHEQGAGFVFHSTRAPLGRTV